MKRLTLAIAAILVWASAAWAAPPAPLSTLRAIRTLSSDQASRNLPVAFEATVTYRRAGETTLFVEDGNEAIYVWTKPEVILTPGDRVLIQGTTRSSFHPIVYANTVTVLSHGALPNPVPATYDELIRGELDCVYVRVRARVRSADMVLSSHQPTTHMQLLADGGLLDVWVNSSDEKKTNQLIDAEVDADGVAGSTFDGKMQRVGAGLSINSLTDIKIANPAETSPEKLPLTEMSEILNDYKEKDLSQRVRVHGTITYYLPGSAIVLQDGAKSLWIATKRELPLRIGDRADVTGFPDLHDGYLTLKGGEVLQSGVYSPLAPKLVTRKELTSSKDIFDLVSIEGQVVTEIREITQDQYVLISDGQVFSAVYRHPVVDGVQLQSPMRHIQPGSRIKVTGICTLGDSNPYDIEVPFDIQMRSPDDVTVLALPSPVNTRNLILIVLLLLMVVAAVGAWGWTLERKVRQKTAALAIRIEAEAAQERRSAQLEQRRSSILEDINGSRPLAEILEAIAAMVSSTLDGAPCWCEIADGAKLGDCPAGQSNLRIVSAVIQARSGPSLGTLHAGLDPKSPPAARELGALNNGAKLATLAIETRRLYSDLLRRSEFDLLTDIHNRFSLETHLESCIEEARASAGIFGLLYIDLDKFKQVNDLYSHRIGDLYLQEVAQRMKQQLRSHDLLARLGGDEFAVLLPMVRNRSGVEEIAQRLEHTFDAPIVLEGNTLHGSASIGLALYPEDGVNKDSLLSAADAAMYAIKNSKKQIEVNLAQE
ncbi:MAG: GGDEF domain-containing protein [Terracidiphilus sp.]|jgi:diguanylate cyclase (GGDEF)-like protein